jgi:hypothetical protein
LGAAGLFLPLLLSCPCSRFLGRHSRSLLSLHPYLGFGQGSFILSSSAAIARLATSCQSSIFPALIAAFMLGGILNCIRSVQLSSQSYFCSNWYFSSSGLPPGLPFGIVNVHFLLSLVILARQPWTRKTHAIT